MYNEDNMTAVKQNRLGCKTPIVTLTLVALVFACVYVATMFTSYSYSDYSYNYELIFYFPHIATLISNLIYIAPFILLTLYIFKFNIAGKTTIIVPIIFGLIAIGPICDFVIYNFTYGYSSTMVDLLLDVITVVLFGLATFGALKGLSNNVFVIIATAFGLLAIFIDFGYYYDIYQYYLDSGAYLFFLGNIAYYLSNIALYVALLLFGLNNCIPAILKVNSRMNQDTVDGISPEKALKRLKREFDNGIITTEEYQKLRSDIINKL